MEDLDAGTSDILLEAEPKTSGREVRASRQSNEKCPVWHGGCNQKSPSEGWYRISCSWMDKLAPN